jgi:cobalt/nickel transport system permease protein
MHIPDGYLSPATDGVMLAAAAPFWAIALKKVRSTLKAKSVPALALFAAFSFVIMMFNIPLPGGTTAHMVGATLLAVVLGPWPAVISISVVLGIQALFFGDGGVLALGANCFNMAVVMPMVGYFVYRMISSGASPSSPRRVAGAAVGAYFGMNAGALFAAVELGLQPMLFHTANGTPLYAPYNLATSIPSIMAGHLLIIGPLEALVTGIIVFSLQRSHSSLLETGELAPSSSRRWAVWVALALLALAAPLGLLASGTAWGEWGVSELQKLGLGYIPQGIQRFVNFWPAPLPDYGFARLGVATGYILSAFVGIGLVVFLLWLGGRALTRRSSAEEDNRVSANSSKHSTSFLSRNIESLSHALESVIASEHLNSLPGLLQRLDPRVKLASFVLAIIVAGLARQLWMLGALLGIILILVLLSRISIGLFLKRVLLFIPLFTAVIAIPALFITPGDALWRIGSHVSITSQGLTSAAFLFLRVTVSLSLGMLLVLTTRWNELLAALRWFRLPALIVSIVGMTYRYVFLFLHTANATFSARRSRTLVPMGGAEGRRWLGQMTAAALSKSQRLGDEVYSAMLARGYTGEVRTRSDLKTSSADYLALGFTLMISILLLWVNYR